MLKMPLTFLDVREKQIRQISLGSSWKNYSQMVYKRKATEMRSHKTELA